MQPPKKVLVTIDPKGKPTIEVVGGEGVGCLTATRQLVDSLGVEETQDLKPEYFHQTEESAQVTVG